MRVWFQEKDGNLFASKNGRKYIKMAEETRLIISKRKRAFWGPISRSFLLQRESVQFACTVFGNSDLNVDSHAFLISKSPNNITLKLISVIFISDVFLKVIYTELETNGMQ